MSLNSRPAPVPAHLQGTRLAALWPRVFARLIDSLIFSLVIGGGSGAVMFFGAGNQSNRTPFWIINRGNCAAMYWLPGGFDA